MYSKYTSFIVSVCAYDMQVAYNNDYGLTTLWALFTVLLSAHLRSRAAELSLEITQLVSSRAKLHTHSEMLLTLTLYCMLSGWEISVLHLEPVFLRANYFLFHLRSQSLRTIIVERVNK